MKAILIDPEERTVEVCTIANDLGAQQQDTNIRAALSGAWHRAVPEAQDVVLCVLDAGDHLPAFKFDGVVYEGRALVVAHGSWSLEHLVSCPLSAAAVARRVEFAALRTSPAILARERAYAQRPDGFRCGKPELASSVAAMPNHVSGRPDFAKFAQGAQCCSEEEALQRMRKCAALAATDHEKAHIEADLLLCDLLLLHSHSNEAMDVIDTFLAMKRKHFHYA